MNWKKVLYIGLQIPNWTFVTGLLLYGIWDVNLLITDKLIILALFGLPVIISIIGFILIYKKLFTVKLFLKNDTIKAQSTGIVIPDSMAKDYLGMTDYFIQNNDIVAFSIPKELKVSETQEEIDAKTYVDENGNLHIEESL